MTSFPSLLARARNGRPGGRGSSLPGTLLALSLLALALLPAAGAGAAGTWQPAAELSASSHVAGVSDVAVDAQGNAVAIWDRFTQSGSSYSDFFIQAATRSAGGRWTTPQDLSLPGETVFGARVRVDGQGNAIALWLRRTTDTSHHVVQVATRPAGASPSSPRGGWSEPQELSTDDQNSSATLAVDEAGNAVAAWNHYTGSGSSRRWSIQVRTRAPDGSWSTPQEISSLANCCGPPSVGISQGNAVVGWTGYTGGRYVVQAVTRPAGASPSSPRAGWSEPETIPDAQPVGGVEVAIDAKGNLVAAWVLGLFGDPNNLNDDTAVVQAATRPAGGSWSAPRDISARDQYVPYEDLRVGSDAQGNAVAVWSRRVIVNLQVVSSHIETASRPIPPDGSFEGGRWSTAQNLSDPDQTADAPMLAVSPQGQAATAWRRFEGAVLGVSFPTTGRYVPVAAVGSAAGTWGSAQDLWQPLVSPNLYSLSTAVGIGSGGDAAALWVDWRQEAPRQVRGAAYDDSSQTPGAGNPTGGGPTAAGAGVGGSFSPASTPPPATGPVPRPGADPLSAALASETRRAIGLRRCLAKATAAARQRAKSRMTPSARRRAAALQRPARQRCLKLHGRTPGRITGLSARALSSTKLALSFNAPGTDSSRPPAARTYLIKQSSRPMRGSRAFTRAQTLCGGACRFSVTQVGTRVTLTITGLRPGSSYFYAVAARDNVSGKVGPVTFGDRGYRTG